MRVDKEGWEASATGASKNLPVVPEMTSSGTALGAVVDSKSLQMALGMLAHGCGCLVPSVL